MANQASARRRGHGEGSIYKRKDGRWAAEVDLGRHDGKRQRKTVYGRTRREVAEKLAPLLKAQQDGLATPNERRRFGEFMEWWLAEEVATSGRADSTKADYAWITRHYILPSLGHLALARLRPQDVQGFRNRLVRDGLSERTVQYALTVLRLALGRAEKLEMVTRNVATTVDVKRPRPDPTKVFAFTVDEARRLLQAARGDRLEALYSVALPIGLRRGETLGLRWVDVDFEVGYLRVEQQVQRVRGVGLMVKPLPKTKSSRRTVKLPAFCLEALRAHRERQAEERRRAGEAWRDHGLVFPSSVGTPMEPRNLNRHFHALCHRAGIDPGRLHNLRHTAASLLLAQGVPMKVVQEVLGHSSMQVTADLYTHVVPVLLQDAADRLDALLGPAPDPLAVNLAVSGPPPEDQEDRNGL